MSWEDDDAVARARQGWIAECAARIDYSKALGDIDPFGDRRMLREKLPGYYSSTYKGGSSGAVGSVGVVDGVTVAEELSVGLVFVEAREWPTQFRGDGYWELVSNFRRYDLNVAWACYKTTYEKPGAYNRCEWLFERATAWEAVLLVLRPRNAFASDAPAQPIRPVEFRGPLAPTGWVRPPKAEDILRLPPPPRTRRLARFDEDV